MDVAKESPRFEYGTLYWYEGNTWDVQFKFLLVNQDNEIVVLKPTDVINVTFKRNAYDRKPIKVFTFTDIEDNTIVIKMDRNTTKLFPRGKYFFGITLLTEEIDTIISENRVVVERVV